ncbi:MAG: MarR family winged helix-turn-helix transcriptional regulator [Campylobacteraceae bacterium]|jgi:DNA-binding MarR family transcriptional regulator|nr:MarR family winged helix-turn-helix transcriptional regulator [Campylobacteraceae bacterium]
MRSDSTFGVKAENSSGFLLWQVTSLWQRRIRKLLNRKYQITHAQYVLLASTYWLSPYNNEVTQNLLVHHTKIEAMNVSQVLKKLEDMNLISRKGHSFDVRAKAVFLTEVGQDLIQKAIKDIEKIDADFFNKLDNGLADFNNSLLQLISYHDD